MGTLQWLRETVRFYENLRNWVRGLSYVDFSVDGLSVPKLSDFLAYRFHVDVFGGEVGPNV